MSKPVIAMGQPLHQPEAGGGKLHARLLLAALAAGLAGGAAGVMLACLLRLVQHLAYGYGHGHLFGPVSFLDGVSAATPLRRLQVMLLCGMVVAGGWWLLRRFATPLLGISQALRPDGRPLPALATTLHAGLQIVTVALGSPLGREVAPRELAVVLTQQATRSWQLAADEQRLIWACAAGAGLAAVYNVPLGGALFVLESLLLSFSWRAVVCAMISSAVAVVIASHVLGDGWQYHVPLWPRTYGLLLWSVLAGPVLGLAGEGFTRLTDWAQRGAPRDWRQLLWPLPVFALIGLVAMWYPQVLGNGRGPASESFDNSLGLHLAAVLLVAKVLAVAASLRAGAAGGLLTPSIAVGALLGLVLGGVWQWVWPYPDQAGAFALVGACAFLASSRRMPLTAIVLLVEFTHVSYDFLIPMMLAVAGAVSSQQLWRQGLAGRGRP